MEPILNRFCAYIFTFPLLQPIRQVAGNVITDDHRKFIIYDVTYLHSQLSSSPIIFIAEYYFSLGVGSAAEGGGASGGAAGAQSDSAAAAGGLDPEMHRLQGWCQ